MQPQPVMVLAQSGLVATLWHQIHVVVGAIQHVEAAGIAGIGVKDRPRGIFVEDADARPFRQRRLNLGIVVIDLAAFQFVRRESDVVVMAEVAADRGRPGKISSPCGV